MEKDNYTLKEVILGTRREYRKLYDYLFVLKALTTCWDKEVQDFYFKLNVSGDEKPEILWRFVQNPRTLKGLIYYLQKSINKFKDTPEYKVVLKNSEDIDLMVNEKYSAFVDNELAPYFEQIIDLIINSNFANMIKFNLHILPEHNGSLLITPNIISYNCMENQQETSLDYYSEFDYIKLHCGNQEHLDISLFKKLLNKCIPAEIFSPYHRGLIDGSSATLKPVKTFLKNDEKISSRSKVRIRELEKEIIFLEQN